MLIKAINPKTGRKEKQTQCNNCCKWVFLSEFHNHECGSNLNIGGFKTD